jgi:hypothetical protein
MKECGRLEEAKRWFLKAAKRSARTGRKKSAAETRHDLMGLAAEAGDDVACSRAQVGMSPTGLTKFIDGGQPYGPTMVRLRKWYYGEAGVHRTPPDLIAAGIADLLRQEHRSGTST